jgi:hypothetical protein
MPNPYFTHATPVIRNTLGRAEQLNQIFQAIEAGFDMLPDADAQNEGRLTYAADTGAANAYVVALPTAPAAYVAGLTVTMLAANANTGASTVNVNALGVKSVRRYDGSLLQAGDILAGAVVVMVYDGTVFRVVSAQGAEVALARAWATSTTEVADLLKGSRGYAIDAAVSAGTAAAQAALASSSSASALAHWQSFRGVYYGALASDPVLDPNGNAIGAGDWYFNTAMNEARIYTGSAWVTLASAAPEIGTWTPAYSPASGAFTTLTHGSRFGRYIRFPNDMVYVEGSISTNSVTVGTAAGTLSVTGLPFALHGQWNLPSIVPWRVTGFATNFPRSVFTASGTSLVLVVQAPTATSDAYVLVSDMTTGAVANRNFLTFGGWYRKAA